jgi:hypothetical protein
VLAAGLVVVDGLLPTWRAKLIGSRPVGSICPEISSVTAWPPPRMPGWKASISAAAVITYGGFVITNATAAVDG